MARKWRRGPQMSKRKKSHGGGHVQLSQRQEDRVSPDMVVRKATPEELAALRRKR